ncbi:MAG: DMT family transporter [Myxococcales bacterium]|nr:DMT family transporter [Myxococcales bacterium]
MPWSASALLTLSAAAFAVMATLVHAAAATIHVAIIVWSRLLVSLIASWWGMRRQGIAMWGDRPQALLLRGLIGAGALSCFFISLGAMPLAQATTIQNAAPLLVAIFAWVALGEEPDAMVWLALALGVGGIALAGEVWSMADVGPWALLTAITGAALAAAAYVTVRQLAQSEPPLRIVFFFPLVALPLTTPWAVAHWRPLRLGELALLLAIGLCTQVGQVAMTMGMAKVSASRAAAYGFLQVPMAMVLGLLLYEVPSIWVVLGAVLILLGQGGLWATGRK